MALGATSPSCSSPVDADLSDVAARAPFMRPDAKLLAAEGLMLPVVADREASGVVDCFSFLAGERADGTEFVIVSPALRWRGGGPSERGRGRC